MRFFLALSSLPSIATAAMSGIEEAELRIRRVLGKQKKMKNLSTYIKNINFEYAVSYSGLRGEKFKNLEKINKEKIRNLEKEIESARFMQKPKLNKKIKELYLTE